jgi:exonuclease I
MSNGFNKKLADLLGKMDDKVLQAKINAAMDILKEGNNEELSKKLGKIDKNELLSKLNELDDSKLKDLNLNKAEMKQKLESVDLKEVQKMLGEQGPEIINKIKDIIK